MIRVPQIWSTKEEGVRAPRQRGMSTYDKLGCNPGRGEGMGGRGGLGWSTQDKGGST